MRFNKLNLSKFKRFSGAGNFLLKPLRFIYLFLLLGIVYFVVSSLIGDRFKIKTVECRLNGQSCPDSFNTISKQAMGTNALFFKSDEFKQKIEKSYPDLAEVKIRLKLPNRLEIDLRQSENLILINLVKFKPEIPTTLPSLNPEASPSAVTEPPSLVFQELNNLNQPPFQSMVLGPSGELHDLNWVTFKPTHQFTLFINNDLPDKDSLKTLFELFAEINLSGLQPINFWANQSSATLELSGNLYIIFSLQKDPRQALVSLQQIRSESTIDFDHTLIDLRFTNPVISHQ